MPSKFVSAVYDQKRGMVQYTDATGKITVYQGGSPCWRRNNPGNLVAPLDAAGQPRPRLTKNFIGYANTLPEHFFFIFPDYETGRGELKASLRRKYNDKPLSAAITAYAPPDDHNDTDAYLLSVTKQTGLSADTVIKDLSDSQLEGLMNAIERQEGYHKDEDTRKVTEIEATSISISDSQKAVVGAKLKVEKGGQSAIISSNGVGIFPLIPNPKDGDPLKVSKQDSAGVWQEVLSIGAGAKSQCVQLVQKAEEYFGISLSDQSAKQHKDEPPALSYRVKPHDSLSKIAAQYKTSVAQLKAINDIKGDAIYPEQMLWINKKGAGEHPPVARAAPLAKGKAKGKASGAAQPAHGTSAAHAASAASAASGKAASEASSASAAKADAAPKKGEYTVDHVLRWLGMAGNNSSGASPGSPPLAAAIAKDGHISPVDPQAGQAPWMAIAIREAVRFSGKIESEITQTENYHRLVTEDDRKGGKVILDKNGEPALDKNGNPKRKFEGKPTLSGDNNAWCASFVNYCLVESNYPYAQGPADAGAFTYAGNVDKFFKLKKPIYGALRVSTRPKGHHVCFVVGKVGDELLVIGGNQSDQILFEKMDAGGLLGYYAPLLYKERAEKEVKDESLAELDINALQKYFGENLFVSQAEQERRRKRKAGIKVANAPKKES